MTHSCLICGRTPLSDAFNCSRDAKSSYDIASGLGIDFFLHPIFCPFHPHSHQLQHKCDERADQMEYHACSCYSCFYVTISAMVPAPTVCPPSRIANRKPFSIATGVISSTVSATLSPGITIS